MGRCRIGVRLSYNLHFSEKWVLFFRKIEGRGIFFVGKEVNLSLFQEKSGDKLLQWIIVEGLTPVVPRRPHPQSCQRGS